MDSKTNEYFFCEMNTRLQVEHPVTEMITGLDLVEWQLRVAGGEPLPILEQAEINDRVRRSPSHAIEARVYAENPLTGFLPATGTLRRLREPQSPVEGGLTAGGATVRVDTGVREGDEVSVFYDPMISKLIVHGKDRDTALDELSRALRSYQVAGLPTNLSFLDRVASHAAFREGSVTTGFLDQYGEEIMKAETSGTPAKTIAIAAVALAMQKQAGLAQAGGDAWTKIGGSWRAFGQMTETIQLREWHQDGDDIDVMLKHHKDGHNFVVEIPSHQTVVSVTVVGMSADGKLTLSVDGDFRFDVDTTVFNSAEGTEIQLFAHGNNRVLGPKHTYHLTQPAPKYLTGADGFDGVPIVRAPMPGKVVRVMVKEGDSVQVGQDLLILEAMKMEHTLKANKVGVVESLLFGEGDRVTDGEILVKLSDPEAVSS